MIGQHHVSSFLEVIISNVLSIFIDIGFVLFCAPYFGLHLTIQTLTIGIVFLYSIHIIKSYFYRRFCNYLMLKELERQDKKNEKKICSCKHRKCGRV